MILILVNCFIYYNDNLKKIYRYSRQGGIWWP